MLPLIRRLLLPNIALLLVVGFLGGMMSVYAHTTGTGEAPLLNAESIRNGVSLVGQWLFKAGDEPAWSEAGLDDSDWSPMELPQRWPEGGFPESGQMGWYRLSLKFDLDSPGQRPELSRIGVRIGKIHNAYELYAGGTLLGGVGKLPPLHEVNYDQIRVFFLPQDAVTADGELVLALRVWGGDANTVRHWAAGPYAGEFTLGEYRSLILAVGVTEMTSLLVNVLFIGFGLYHLYLYRRNPQLEAFLWFGLMAINIGIYGLMLNQWKFFSGLSFITLKKFEYGAIYLLPALGIQTIWTLLGRPIGRPLRLYQLSFVGLALLVVLIPGLPIHYHTLQYWQFATLPVLALTAWVLIKEVRAGHPEARTIIVGVMLFMATCLNDLLIDIAKLQTTRLAPYGFIAIMLAMAVSLANRFTGMLNELEAQVAKRTAQLRSANRQLAEAARVDPLTRVLNRRGFAEEAEAEVQRAIRSGRNFTLILADIDEFKRFNDRYGHACGDHLLVRVAHIIGSRVRDVDRVARWGGEEFIVLLPETELEGAAVLAEKLRESIACNLFEFEGQSLSITMTFGLAAYRQGEGLDSCVARADAALYQGKEQGRNKVMIGNYQGLTLVN